MYQVDKYKTTQRFYGIAFQQIFVDLYQDGESSKERKFTRL
jgi:hypothetical protein